MNTNQPPESDSPNPDAAPLGPPNGTDPSVTVIPPEPKKDNRRPLGPHVFGKFAIFITVVPYVFYLASGGFASYIEGARAHAYVKEQTHLVSGPLGATVAELKSRTANQPGAFDRIRNEWNLPALTSLLSAEEEEDFTAEKLDKLLEPLRDETLLPEFPAKVVLREQMLTLLKLKELEDDHKYREVFAVSHEHFSDLQVADGEGFDDDEITADSATSTEWFPADKTWYPATYTITVAITALLMLIVFRGYFKAPFKITIWSVIVGVVGIVVWIGVTELDRNVLHISEMLGFSHSRDAFNPFEELKSNQAWMWQFMAIRFAGLVLVVPLIEEFFIRGFLMRYIDDPDWDQMPLAEHGALAIGGVLVYAGLSHTGELLAAVIWFGMVTWLFLKTKSIWDCVVAHAITNLLLGIFVCYTGWWYYW